MENLGDVHSIWGLLAIAIYLTFEIIRRYSSSKNKEELLKIKEEIGINRNSVLENRDLKKKHLFMDKENHKEIELYLSVMRIQQYILTKPSHREQIDTLYAAYQKDGGKDIHLAELYRHYCKKQDDSRQNLKQYQKTKN